MKKGRRMRTRTRMRMRGRRGRSKRSKGRDREDVVEGACELGKVDEREAARGTEPWDVAAHDAALGTHVPVAHRLLVAVGTCTCAR